MMHEAGEYLGLITREHASKPRFMAYNTMLLQPVLDFQAFCESVTPAFDIDTAVGIQLDTLGKWIGMGRAVPVPITGVYFTFDTGPGFDKGIFRGQYDPTTTMESLPDEQYRRVLKARIEYNHWNGSIPQAVDGMKRAFPEADLIIQTYPGGSMTYVLYGPLKPIDQAIFDAGYFDFKPAGVSFERHLSTIHPVFGFDANGTNTRGFDAGQLL